MGTQQERYQRWYACHREEQRERVNAWRAANREKARAHSRIAHEKERHGLQAKPCEVCGAPKTDAHHDDYSRPLDVRWLCRQHHNAKHHG